MDNPKNLGGVHVIGQDEPAARRPGRASLGSANRRMTLHTAREIGIRAEWSLFTEAARGLNLRGVPFGATFPFRSESLKPERPMNLYNSRNRIFANIGDSSDDPRAVLKKNLTAVEFHMYGYTRIWVATK